MNQGMSDEAATTIQYIVHAVAERGWVDVEVSTDDFECLRKDPHVRNAIVAALYEEYFLPERHEFEWQVLEEIVRAIASSPATQWAAAAIAGGVAGNAAWDLLKTLCSHAAESFRTHLPTHGHTRGVGFELMERDAKVLKSFFRRRKRARLDAVEEATGLPQERIRPLLKLVGFRHYRRGGDTCNWERPW